MSNKNLRRLISIGLVVIMAVVFSLTTDSFLTTRNILQLFRESAFVGLLALGMAFVIIGGGIDLSAGGAVTPGWYHLRTCIVYSRYTGNCRCAVRSACRCVVWCNQRPACHTGTSNGICCNAGFRFCIFRSGASSGIPRQRRNTAVKINHQ